MTAETRAVSRVIVFDPGMGMRAGHHYPYNMCIQKAFADAGIPVTVLCNSYAQPDVVAEFDDCRAVVAGVHYLPPREHMDERADYESRVAALFAALHEHVTPLLGEGTVLISHTSKPFTIKALDLWSRGLGRGVKPQMFFNLHGYPGGTRFIKDLQDATAVLKAEPKAHLLGSYASIAARLEKMTGMPAGVLPAPLALPPAALAMPRPAKTVFGFAGEGRETKNMHLLPLSVLEYMGQGGQGDFSFSFYPMDDAAMYAAQKLNSIRLMQPERMRLDPNYLSHEDYYKAIAGMSCLLLTYGENSPVPSGVLQEAMCLGVPVILPGKGALYDEISRLGGGFVEVAALSPQSMAEAMRYFDNNRGEIIGRAKLLAARYRAFHSAGNLVKFLCGAEDALTAV